MAQLECLDDSVKKDDLAVIFIHGLNGDARKTWMMDEKDDSTLWPRWLASDLDCSVWVLGYDAKLSSWQDNAMPLPDQGDSVLETLATEEGLKHRSLLLIGHSMGGLVIKTLIHHGRTKGVPRYERVIKRIRGISFVATPHNGSQLATLAKYITSLLGTNPQVGNMQNHDPHLQSLNQQFLAYVNAEDTCVAVRTFAERKPVKIGSKWFKPIHTLVVDANSSEPHVPHEIAVPLPEDHISICKLTSKDDQLYKSMLAFIKEDVLPKSQPLRKPDVETVGESAESPPADKIQITKLPHTNSRLLGRKTQLAMLDRAWDEGINVLILKAMGGTGKTALLKYWLDQFVASGYRGAEAVFTWSFYSQGSAENKQTSTDDFFESALRFFGYAEQNLPPPHERGIKLAQLVASQRTLLILDGLEPLQHPVGIFHGELKDQGLKALLQQLAGKNAGLCLISSRQTVEELKGKPEKLVLPHNLEQLDEKDGVDLLRDLDVEGSDDELKKAVKEVAGHALSLNLLGNYVKKVLNGDIRQRDKIPGLMAERNDGKHAEKMLAAYETHLKGTTALSALYLLGLFERPVSPGAIRCLKAAEIHELTDQLGSDTDWCYAIDDLREQRLLNAPNPDYPDNLDCHPLIREYFGKQLQTQYPDAWQQAHARLYEYYKDLPENPLPDTLEEMQPLFSAVAHGCAAGLYKQALGEVYYPRIKRKDEHYLTKKFGAFSDDLASLAHFFNAPWRTPAAGFTDPAAVLLNWAGFGLRALGRLREAVEPMLAYKKVQAGNENWENAAIATCSLSELQLALGDLSTAVRSAAQGVAYADKSGDMFFRIMCCTAHADALHQAGQALQARELFQAAEALQEEHQPDYLRLYSLRGFQYCDLLLAQGETAVVLERAEQTLGWAKQQATLLLDIALDQLTLGRAHLQQAIEESPPNRPLSGEGQEQAADWLEQAEEGLRTAGDQRFVPLGLLARAALFRHTHDFVRARQDLREVFDIAEPSGMRLHLTDYHLEMARLLVEEAKTRTPTPLPEVKGLQKHIEEAERLITYTGYHRRDAELDELKAQRSTR